MVAMRKRFSVETFHLKILATKEPEEGAVEAEVEVEADGWWKEEEEAAEELFAPEMKHEEVVQMEWEEVQLAAEVEEELGNASCFCFP